jgi:hypothetical protein
MGAGLIPMLNSMQCSLQFADEQRVREPAAFHGHRILVKGRNRLFAVHPLVRPSFPPASEPGVTIAYEFYEPLKPQRIFLCFPYLRGHRGR